MLCKHNENSIWSVWNPNGIVCGAIHRCTLFQCAVLVCPTTSNIFFFSNGITKATGYTHTEKTLWLEHDEIIGLMRVVISQKAFLGPFSSDNKQPQSVSVVRFQLLQNIVSQLVVTEPDVDSCWTYSSTISLLLWPSRWTCDMYQKHAGVKDAR